MVWDTDSEGRWSTEGRWVTVPEPFECPQFATVAPGLVPLSQAGDTGRGCLVVAGDLQHSKSHRCFIHLSPPFFSGYWCHRVMDLSAGSVRCLLVASSGMSVSLKSKYLKRCVAVLHMGPARPAGWLQQSRTWGSGTWPPQLGAAGHLGGS